MKLTKFVAITLALCIFITLCACGSATSVDDTSSDADEYVGEIHDPGPYMNGYDLHYANDEGYDITNCMAGFLQFDENGIYTSGNKDLDAKLRNILEEIVDPSAQTRLEMLRSIYNYVRDNNTYSPSRYYETGSTGWEKEATIELLDRGSGNCFSYAALYTMLARCIGYQVEGVSGIFRGGQHGWTEVIIDGKLYYSDPQYEATAGQEFGLFNVAHDEEVRRIQEYTNPNRDMSKINDPIAIVPVSSLDNSESSSDTSKFDANRFKIASNYIGMSVDKLIDAIGEPNSREYAPSCSNDNAEDGTLEYNGFVVYTVKYEDKELVSDVY